MDEAHTRGAEGMAKGDGSSIWIDAIGDDSEFGCIKEYLGRKSFIDLPDIDLGDAPASAFSRV